MCSCSCSSLQTQAGALYVALSNPNGNKHGWQQYEQPRTQTDTSIQPPSKSLNCNFCTALFPFDKEKTEGVENPLSADTFVCFVREEEVVTVVTTVRAFLTGALREAEEDVVVVVEEDEEEGGRVTDW